MSLKEFLEKCCWQNRTCGFCDEVEQVKMYFEIDDLFEFLWERGAKQFVKGSWLFYSECNSLDDFSYENIKESCEDALACGDISADEQDFLDCVTINEEEVKKRIKELE